MATRDRKLLVTVPGLLAVAIWLLLTLAGTALLLGSLTGGDAVSLTGVAVALLLGLLLLVALRGFVIIQPNQAKVAVFLGRYLGTVRRSGFWWINPLTTRRTLSLRIRNLDTDVLRVNDANGNPIEISAVITWQVADAAQAAFDVEDYDAIVAARQRIVEGAVGMVDHALSSLNERDIVDLDEERKAAMVSNVMVVLVSDRGAQPVVNSGSLYT